MSYTDTLKALKVISTVCLGQFAGSAIYAAVSVQPSLIEQKDVSASSKVMRSILQRSYIMPICSLLSASSSLAVYLKTRGTFMEDSFWLFSSGIMFALIPYTNLLIGPINLQFRVKDEEFDGDDDKWAELLSDWLTFHTPRALISFALFTVGVCKLVNK